VSEPRAGPNPGPSPLDPGSAVAKAIAARAKRRAAKANWKAAKAEEGVIDLPATASKEGQEAGGRGALVHWCTGARWTGGLVDWWTGELAGPHGMHFPVMQASQNMLNPTRPYPADGKEGGVCGGVAFAGRERGAGGVRRGKRGPSAGWDGDVAIFRL
jgi:hypothetical protein